MGRKFRFCDEVEVRNNIYLDCGSVVDTDITKDKDIMSDNWNEGCITEITIGETEIEICMSSIRTRIKFPGGYYYLNLKNIIAATKT